MGWFGSDNSQKQGDEFDLGQPLIYNQWTRSYFSRYENIKEYLVSRIGKLNIKDETLQNKMSNMMLENSKESFEV